MCLPANCDRWAFRELIDSCHVCLWQGLKTFKLYIACDSWRSCALGKDSKVVAGVKGPQQDNFSDIKFSLGRDALKSRMFYQGLMHLSEWRICLNYNTSFLAGFYSFMFNIHRMNFELIDNWLDFCDCHQFFDMMRQEIWDANEFYWAFLDVFFESFPWSMSVLYMHWVIILQAFGRWEMQKHQINVF